jgi:hypothetical protein
MFDAQVQLLRAIGSRRPIQNMSSAAAVSSDVSVVNATAGYA